MSEKDMSTSSIGSDRAIIWRRSVLLSNFGRRPALGAAIFVAHRIFVLNLDSYVEIDDLQTIPIVTYKVVMLCL